MSEQPKSRMEICAEYTEIKNTEIYWKEISISVRISGIYL